MAEKKKVSKVLSIEDVRKSRSKLESAARRAFGSGAYTGVHLTSAQWAAYASRQSPYRSLLLEGYSDPEKLKRDITRVLRILPKWRTPKRRA